MADGELVNNWCGSCATVFSVSFRWPARFSHLVRCTGKTPLRRPAPTGLTLRDFEAAWRQLSGGLPPERDN